MSLLHNYLTTGVSFAYGFVHFMVYRLRMQLQEISVVPVCD